MAGRSGKGGGWLNHPVVAGQGYLSSILGSGGSQRGLLGYSPWRWTRGLQGGQLRMGALPSGAKGWGRNWGNRADGDGRGATQMPTCSLLHARRESQALLVPTSSPRQHLQSVFSAGLNHPELQWRAASFLEGHGDTHLLLHGLVMVRKPAEEQDKSPGCTGKRQQSLRWGPQPARENCHHKKAPCETQRIRWSWPRGHIRNHSAALARITAMLCLTGKREILNKVVSTFLYW